MTTKEKKLDKIFWELQSSDGIGPKTARAFMDYIKDNREEILNLLSFIKLTGDIKYKANVVFTGFRPTSDIEARFNAAGIEVSNSVSSNTVAVITASTESASGKSKAAISKGIPIIHASRLEEFLKDIA
jgi:NAD-dependent DNA ligase